jgi:chloramphenicol-sensitive protein RarD
VIREIIQLPDPNRSCDSRLGIIAGLAAYGLWGLMPLYFTALSNVPAFEILAQRIVWCTLFLAIVVTIVGRWPEVARGLRSPIVLATFLTSSLLLSVNWITYIHGVVTKQTVETSLGYFINPLLNVALGMVFFRERLRPMQLAAVALATGGVLNLIFAAGHIPWIAFSLAGSFAFYGLVRKTAPSDALLGLTFETLILFVPACVFAIYLARTDGLAFNLDDWKTNSLLLASGVITAIPLLLFGVAAKNVRLATLGFIQYLAPTCQFLLAVAVLGEPMSREKWVSFAFIWTALAIYSVDTWWAMRQESSSANGQQNRSTIPNLGANGTGSKNGPRMNTDEANTDFVDQAEK